jgi:glycosyltransferase involved in cell wall biosynthesis
MLVKNSFEYDARVTKEARTLVRAGHDVTVIALLVPGVTPTEELRPDGIRVARVHRMQFGIPTLNRVARRYAAFVETRRSRLLGEPVDVDRIREYGTIHVASTATPGDDTPSDGTRVLDVETHRSDPSGLRHIWGVSTTALLRSLARGMRYIFGGMKFLLGRAGQALKAVALNRAYVSAAIGTGADVYHSHDVNTLYVGTVCKRRTGAKLVYDSHELATGRNRMGFWWKAWASFWERRGIPHADAVIMASPGYARHVRDRYQIPQPSVILNGPERSDIHRNLDLRSTLSIPAETRILVYQGSVQENRGIEQVIDAMTDVEDATLIIIGYGSHRPRLERMVRSREWTDRVRFFGPVPNDQIVSYAASGDVGICCIVPSSASYIHSLPNKLFEYIMAGLPVVVSDFPEMGSVVRQTDVGEVCDPTDPADIATAITKIIDDPERSEQCRANTLAAAERYNWDVEGARLLDIYAAFT